MFDFAEKPTKATVFFKSFSFKVDSKLVFSLALAFPGSFMEFENLAESSLSLGVYENFSAKNAER